MHERDVVGAAAKANRRVPQKQNLSVKLIISLFHQPVWFGGILAGFLLQATALGMGQLTVVEPILVLELPATLILGSRVFGTRLGRREWAVTAAMTAGLAGLLCRVGPAIMTEAGPSGHGPQTKSPRAGRPEAGGGQPAGQRSRPQRSPAPGGMTRPQSGNQSHVSQDDKNWPRDGQTSFGGALWQ